MFMWTLQNKSMTASNKKEVLVQATVLSGISQSILTLTAKYSILIL